MTLKLPSRKHRSLLFPFPRPGIEFCYISREASVQCLQHPLSSTLEQDARFLRSPVQHRDKVLP
jgi:hypothetical protein